MSTAAELRQILKEDASGKDLYEHLTEVLMKLLIDRPKNAYDSFELISAEVKANPLSPDPEFAKGKSLPLSAEQLEKQLNWTNNCAKLLKIPDEPPEDSGVKFPDLMDESTLLEWAGVSLGKGETYRLYLSIKKLAESLPPEAERIRFFGKISTRTLPYYVLECVSPEEEEGINEFQQEGKSGANKYAYYVSQSFESGNSSWIKLPNVTMRQIVQCRQFKRLLTGSLDAPVSSYPPFDGTEKNLLRAQIARIVGATSISPDGFFTLSEDDPPAVVPAEAEALNEAFPKASSELKEPDAWKHHECDLNKVGRVTAMPEQLDEAGEPITPEDPDAQEPTPQLDPIKPENWALRLCPGGSGVSSSSSVVAKSLLWPGASAIAVGKRFLNIYIGNGVVYEPSKPFYSPPLPGLIQTEYSISGNSEDSGLMNLMEQPDTRVDPTPPKPEGEEEEA